MQDLKIHCVWSTLATAHDIEERNKFFDYIKVAHEFCPDETINYDCDSWGLKAANLTRETIDQCVADTFKTKGKIGYDRDENEKMEYDL